MIAENKNSKPFLSLEETADYLNLSRNTVYSYTHRKLIPFYKLRGRKLYFKIEELNKFILNEKNRINKTGGELWTNKINFP